MKLTLKYHGEFAAFFPDDTQDNLMIVRISQDDSISSVMDKLSIPLEKINLVLVNGIKVKNYDCENYRFADGDTLAIWPVTK